MLKYFHVTVCIPMRNLYCCVFEYNVRTCPRYLSVNTIRLINTYVLLLLSKNTLCYLIKCLQVTSGLFDLSPGCRRRHVRRQDVDRGDIATTST